MGPSVPAKMHLEALLLDRSGHRPRQAVVKGKTRQKNGEIRWTRIAVDAVFMQVNAAIGFHIEIENHRHQPLSGRQHSEEGCAADVHQNVALVLDVFLGNIIGITGSKGSPDKGFQ